MNPGTKVQVQEVTEVHVTVTTADKTWNLPRELFPSVCTSGMIFFLSVISESEEQQAVHKTAKEVLNELLGNSS